MKLQVMAVLTLLGAAPSLGFLSGGHAPQPGHPDVAHVVRGVTDDAYGKTYDPMRSCWEFTVVDDLGEPTMYCMRSGEDRIVETKQGTKFYFSSFNATDTRDGAL